MFREMRRKRQALSAEEIADVLYKGTSGVLALSGEDGYPYAVPISYVYDGNKIYFHCAKSGHKLDAIQRNAKASFCVIDQDQIVPEEYTTYFRSVIAFGKIRVIEGETEKRSAIEKLAMKYAPEDTAAGRKNAIDREWKPLCMLEMSIDHMTGKEAIELVKKKQ
ncbi:MAG: pyridoxamine 5'-phosphate oxidase family protein [Oscillospiraceae bacterium]|nr:pyridoxamine 5'-phosphate oxidase family protein [Oscillospiraceae bacterium]